LRFLLDENLPLQLHRTLVAAGLGSEHIITSGQRGLSDGPIRARLAVEDDLVLVTQDTRVRKHEVGLGTVIISRVPQTLPVCRRVEIWFEALSGFAADTRPGGCSTSSQPARSSGGNPARDQPAELRPCSAEQRTRPVCAAF
jgi:hypothetical protein